MAAKKRERENTQVTNIGNTREDTTKDPTDFKKRIREEHLSG